MDYIEFDLKITPKKPWTEIAIANLAEFGFDSFVESENGVLAYIAHENYNEFLVCEILNEIMEKEVVYKFNSRLIPHQNWNAAWESEFEPVHVGDKLSILAPFHDKNKANKLQLEIMPKMSFGTGHHQTTQIMCELMFDIDFKGKKVLDMGSGTGVLAILAEKKEAEYILAVDIEDWSAENIVENSQRNACEKIESRCGDIDCVSEDDFDIILANINRNILMNQIPYYSTQIKKGGLLLLSGFLESDLSLLINHAENNGFLLLEKRNKEMWFSLMLKKSH